MRHRSILGQSEAFCGMFLLEPVGKGLFLFFSGHCEGRCEGETLELSVALVPLRGKGGGSLVGPSSNAL